MPDPVQIISNFFQVARHRYYVKAPAGQVLDGIRQIPASSRLWNHPDIEISFLNDCVFRLRLTFFSLKIRGLSSWMRGEVTAVSETETLVETQTSGNPSLFLLYFVFSMAGLVLLHRYLLLHGTAPNLLGSLLLLMGFPYAFAWYKYTTDERLQEHFEEFMGKFETASPGNANGEFP